jgi:hypothetical protein
MSQDPAHGSRVGDWHRYHPTANRIARELLRERALLNLRTGRLVRDVMAARRVGACTARIAVALARKTAGIAA